MHFVREIRFACEMRCGEKKDVTAHSAGAAATCTEDQICTVCKRVLDEKNGHSFDNACDASCNYCEASRTVSNHIDANVDKVCDECGAELPKEDAPIVLIIGAVSAATVAIGGAFIFLKKKKLR